MNKLHIKDLRKNDIFVEVDYGYQMRYIALEDAHYSQYLKTWFCKAQHIKKDGSSVYHEDMTPEMVTFEVTDDCPSHYMSKIYLEEHNPYSGLPSLE